MNTLVIIPVRMASTRLPQKPMADILGKTMIRRVYEKAVNSNVGPVVVACDGDIIADEVKKFDGNFVITDPNLPSGTDRVYAAYKNLIDNKTKVDGINPEDFEIVVNLQGDLPEIDPSIIRNTADLAISHKCDIATAAAFSKLIEDVNNPSVVKIATAGNSIDGASIGSVLTALYFSRNPIPFSKKHAAGDMDEFYKHIGIYAYKAKALERFVKLPVSFLETRENLEQLRALEDGMKIMVKMVDSYPISIDTQQDLNLLISTLS